MLLKCLLVALVLDDVFGCGKKAPPPNKPPTITCPSVKTTHIADKGETHTSVTWGNPTAKDPEGKISSIQLMTGKASGDVFGRGSHSVSYVVTDGGGLKDFCTFTFVVKVKTCRPVFYLRDGRVSCSGNIFGKTCDFICDDGFKLVGQKQVSCLQTEKWSAKNPQCVAKECSSLTVPKNGKEYVCTDERRVGSICWLTCKEEKGYAPTRGQWTQCTKKQKWTNLRMECEDVDPPTINNCPATTVVQTKEPSSDMTEVVWPKLTVSDNSGEKIVIRSTLGSISPTGGVFAEGTHLVSFKAQDKAGNRAEPCFFMVRIQSVVCDPPKFDDTNLDTPGCMSFKEGESCKLKCYLALNLVGDKYITCRKQDKNGPKAKGYWDWGQGADATAVKPFCEVHKCPKLRAPDYGAMICDEWSKGESCQLQCNEEYDIPASVPFPGGNYLCGRNTGKWNFEDVPDCAYREQGDDLRLANYYYFYGSCQDAKAEIKVNFLTAIEEIGACPAPEYCKVDNVNVLCGDEPEDTFDFRRKRSASSRRRGGSRRRRTTPAPRRRKAQFIKYDIIVPQGPLNGTFAQTIQGQKGKLISIVKRIKAVVFTAGGRSIKSTRVRIKAPLPVCRPGLQIGTFHKDSCVPCPAGSYHNAARDECVACPLGQFVNKAGQTTCKKCPHGQTTVTLANRLPTACKVMCSAGHYSKDGVVPCFKCPRGTYEDSQNSTRCEDCPVGTTTATDGVTSKSQCIPYDILMQGPFSVPIEGKSPSQICDFTFAVWFKMAERTSSGIKFEIYSPVTGVGVEIALSRDVNVYINKKHHVVVRNVISTKWVHVGVVWANKKLTVYIGGSSVLSQTLTAANKCPVPTRSSMRVAIRDHAYMYLRDLNFLTSATPNILKTMAKTCSTYKPNSLFSLEQLDMLTHPRINEVIPSTCLRLDVCSSRPCGENVCIPTMEGYSCACRGGYSGKNCQIAPDLCKNNICRNKATCIVTGRNAYRCACASGFRGTLCETKIADGGWSKWMDWGSCSTSCGTGRRVRQRFCDSPPPDRGGKMCPGPKTEGQECQLPQCPECDASTLIVGKGIIPTCVKKGKSVVCSVKCQIGKVFPEPPLKYTCNKGMWTPTQQTLSCTDPVSPIVAGINYTVVFDNSLSSHEQVRNRLNTVGNSFSCSKTGGCNFDVGSSACSSHVGVCESHAGNYYGSLIVKKPVPAGQIHINQLQQNEKVNPYLAPLFDTWNFFQHTSDELVTADHRELVMNIVNNQLKIHPYQQPAQSVVIPGQFGAIMKTWKFLDDVNWEVRNNSYSNFHLPLGRRLKEPKYLSATQIMTCPPGAVRGGVFCMKCPPGKMYVEGECRRCRNGFFQDEPGMSNCKPCQGFKTTENLGCPLPTQCIDTDVSQLRMVMSLQQPGVGILPMNSFNFRKVTLKMTQGNIDRFAYNPRDSFLYYSTQSPAVLGRIGLNGQNEDLLMELPSGTLVTGLDVDVGSGLLLYTTHDGQLIAFHVVSRANYVIVDGLTRPRDLVLDQNFGAYWIENNKLMYMTYSSQTAQARVTDKYAIFSPVVDKKENKLMWQSYSRLRSANMDGTNVQTLASGFTSRFGHTDEYYFHISSTGKLVRVNRDLSARVDIHPLPNSVVRMKVINTTDDTSVQNLCKQGVSDCQHGCFPLTKTSRRCFCADDYTLQSNHKSCRADFSARLTTSEASVWNKPKSKDYSVPPSMTLRLKVKACHSARVALAKNNRELYTIQLGIRRGNVTEMTIKKQGSRGPTVLLVRKEINLLDCNKFKVFWVTWLNKRLRVGSGEVVGENRHLVAADARPHEIRYVMFGTGPNATAEWLF